MLGGSEGLNSSSEATCSQSPLEIVAMNNSSETDVSLDRPEWFFSFQGICQFYIIPILCAAGVIFNIASISVLFSNYLHLQKSLVSLFSFLNMSDCCFLICTYMVFGLQNIWEEYNDKMIKNAIPYLLPALQTFLTISVYATIAIAINGALAVQSSNNDIGLRQKLTFWIEERGLNGTTLAIIAVILFSAIFNISRWFEFEAVSEVSPDNSTNQTSSISSMKTILKSTPLRENPIYVQYYGLIGSCIIMVFVPTATLVLSCFSLRKAIPDGSQKRKILKIMVIIIVMFILCHVPKVILTGYEIGINPTMSTWSTWALVLKEMSHILLVSYSALNPIAYCGDLIRKKLILSVWQDGFAVCCRCTSLNQGHNRNIHSEFVTMKSIGVTLNGVDPLQQQLHELDAQSRLLTGLQPTDRQRGSGDIQQAVNV